MLSDVADLVIVHISDIHIKDASDPVLRRAREIARVIQSDSVQAKHLAVLVTGDIAFSGKPNQYELATSFFLEVQEELRRAFGQAPHLVVIPGNHDCDFEHPAQKLRKILLEQQRESAEEVPAEVLEHCCQIMGPFEEFRGAVETLRPAEFTPVWRRYELNIDSSTISINAINDAWAAEKRLEPGSLAFPVDQHADMAVAKADVRISMLHCPEHWLHQSLYRRFRKLIHECSDVVLTGHEHVLNAGVITDLESGQTAFAEAGALQESGTSTSEFAVLRLHLAKKRFEVSRYRFVGDTYVADQGATAFVSFDLPHGQGKGFRFTPDWTQKLGDIGAALKHHAKTRVELLDLFVFPDVRADEDLDDGSPIFSSRDLLELSNETRALLIKGDQGIGKTSLLRAYASLLRDRGYVPVLINGVDLKQSSVRELQKTIATGIVQQYGETQKTAVEKLGPEQKVLLLDNIDRYGFPDKYFNDVVEVLQKSFGWIIATADTLFDFKAAVYGETYQALHEFEPYSLKPLGVRARHELVRKWYQLERADTREEEERIRRNISEAEKILSGVVGRGLVPAFPMYMLVLLQGTEAGRQGELENSALGTYYQYLLVHSLLDHTSQDQVSGVFNYCAHLAWYLKQAGKQGIGERELRDFHSAFERLYDLDIPFVGRLDLLIKSRVLVETGAEVGFRYPYSYYFFLGSYIAARLNKNQEVDSLVRNAADALHVRENANILLFVAHHSQGSVVMGLVQESVERLFANVPPIKFQEDTDSLNKAVDELPKLVYEEAKAESRRAELLDKDAEVAANLDEAGSKQPVSKEAAEALAMVADLNALFKGIEILGAALKSNADNVEASEKQRVLGSVFEGGLRGLRALFDKLTSEPGYLLSEMQEVIDKKKPETPDDKQRLASQAIFFFLSSLGYVFIRRMGTAVGSKTLRPSLARYVQENPTVASRLVHVSCALETPGPLPIASVKQLNEELKGQAFPTSILRQLALARVYLYYTEAMERQQLCDELDIEMRTQRAIDYQTKDTKKVQKSG